MTDTVTENDVVTMKLCGKSIPLRPTPRKRDGKPFHAVRNGPFRPSGVVIPSLTKTLPRKVHVLGQEVTLTPDPEQPRKVRGTANVGIGDEERLFRITVTKRHDGNWNLTSSITRKGGSRDPVSLSNL